MTILVTGGCGYIGSHVVRQLSENSDQQILVLDNLSTGSSQALVNNEELLQIDLSEVDSLNKVFQDKDINSVIHFAASVVVPESVSNPLKYYQNNTRNTLNLLNACTTYGVKNFIFSSTAAIYGFPGEGYASEDETPVGPINPYGKSKLMSEWMLNDIAAACEMKFVILRYFNVAGADPKARMGQRTPEATHLIKVCCQAAAGLKSAVSIFGTDYPTPDGTCIRDYIHIEDLADAHLKALDYLKAGGDSTTLNVGYGKGLSVKEVIEMAHQVTKVNFSVKKVGRRPGDPAIIIAKANKVREKLGWEPKFDSLEKIVSDAWNWERTMLNLTK
jgi:UDP-glucose 4-epimerase